MPRTYDIDPIPRRKVTPREIDAAAAAVLAWIDRDRPTIVLFTDIVAALGPSPDYDGNHQRDVALGALARLKDDGSLRQNGARLYIPVPRP